MTSYQRRKQDIIYLEQCIKDLKCVVRSFHKQLKENKIRPKLIDFSISGDTILTPYNMDDSSFWL